MRTIPFYRSSAILVAAVMVTVVLAQPAATTPETSVLDQAAALIGDNKPKEARELLATIPATAPEYRVARFYDALAIHESGDQIGFLKALAKLPQDATGVPSEVSENLAAREVQSLLFFRRFEELLPKARVFLQNHAGSTRYASVKDCLIAGLFDRGMKQVEDACRSQDEAAFNIRWPEAKANLEEFLSLVASTGVTTWQSLPKRNVQQDVWVARMTLGDEEALWGEIPATDAAARERLSLLRLRLYQRLQRNETDKNIRFAKDFLAEFPGSVHCKKVEFEMANVALLGGERLVNEGWRSGNGRIADAKRAEATPHLEMALRLYSQVVEDKEAGIGATELKESRMRIVRAHYAQRDWDRLTKWCAHVYTNSPDEKEWLVVRLYEGAALTRQMKFTEAAKAMDEVLALGFRNTPSYDGLLISAAQWRIIIAKQTGDDAVIQRVMEQVQRENCYGSIRRTFLAKFGIQPAQPGPASK